MDKRNLVGYSPWGRKELDTTERLTHTHTHTHPGINAALGGDGGRGNKNKECRHQAEIPRGC